MVSPGVVYSTDAACPGSLPHSGVEIDAETQSFPHSSTQAARFCNSLQLPETLPKPPDSILAPIESQPNTESSRAAFQSVSSNSPRASERTVIPPPVPSR